MLLCSHACATLTCCFSTRFFTPSITNWEPVFITLENRLVGGEREEEEARVRLVLRSDGGGLLLPSSHPIGFTPLLP